MMLQVEKLNVYYGESHILRDVSFEVEPGRVTCLMGRNGVGKTTTLKAIMGLLPTRAGQIKFAGTDITKKPTDRRVKQGLVYVPQGREIIPPGGVLSGGEQQQLAIGRGLLSEPKVLLLDEPTEGIQPSIIDQIEDVIIGFKKSRRFAILLVEQGLHFAARLAETYVVMAKGTVVAAGKSDELSAEMVRQHLTV